MIDMVLLCVGCGVWGSRLGRGAYEMVAVVDRS